MVFFGIPTKISVRLGFSYSKILGNHQLLTVSKWLNFSWIEKLSKAATASEIKLATGCLKNRITAASANRNDFFFFKINFFGQFNLYFVTEAQLAKLVETSCIDSFFGHEY